MHKIWLNKFNPEWDFVCNKPKLAMGSKSYGVGETVDKSLVSERRLKLLYESRKIIPVETKEVVAAKPGTVETSPTTSEPALKPEITGPLQGGWYRVMLGDEQIGKSTRDRDEAELIVMEWEENNVAARKPTPADNSPVVFGEAA